MNKVYIGTMTGEEISMLNIKTIKNHIKPSFIDFIDIDSVDIRQYQNFECPFYKGKQCVDEGRVCALLSFTNYSISCNIIDMVRVSEKKLTNKRVFMSEYCNLDNCDECKDYDICRCDCVECNYNRLLEMEREMVD